MLTCVYCHFQKEQGNPWVPPCCFGPAVNPRLIDISFLEYCFSLIATFLSNLAGTLLQCHLHKRLSSSLPQPSVVTGVGGRPEGQFTTFRGGSVLLLEPLPPLIDSRNLCSFVHAGSLAETYDILPNILDVIQRNASSALSFGDAGALGTIR